MMNHLEIILKLLYKRVPIQAVLENKLLYNCFDRNTFMKMAVSYLPNYSENEAENILLYYIDTFRDKAHSKGHAASDELNVFDALFYYADDCLTVQNNSVLCKYNRLVYWRQMTLELSEDLIVSAFLAQEYFHEEQVKERGFMWKRVIGHNNIQLNQILARGISENHFHLAGSSPIFHISWLSLMNNVTSSKLAEHLKQYDSNRRYTNTLYSNEYKEQSFYYRYLQAALIRVLLYSKITNMRIHIGNYVIPSQDAFRLLHIPEFQNGTGEQRISMQKFYHAILSSHKNEFYLQEVFCISFFETAHYSKEEAAALKDILVQNPLYDQLFFHKMAYYKLQKHVILQNLSFYRSSPEGITLKQLAKFLFSCISKICLDDIPIHWTDHDAFLKLWETITLKNALKLLHHPELLENFTTELQAIIDSFRFPPDKPISDDTQEIDYLLHQIKRSGVEKENPYFIFAGERWLLYTMLHQIYRNDSRYAGYYHLFYAYILIKETIRSEIIQSNNNVGFKNFQIYQNRKLDLLKDAIYENASVKLALKECLLTENIRTLELRISPQNTTEELRTQIMKLDNLIDPSSSFRHQFFYTLHFIKSSDKTTADEPRTTCRHYKKRESIRQQVMAIIHLREQYPEVAKRILGIDAAANEIGCRPQVFGQFFRQLKKHTSVYYETDGQHKLPQLRATYHVGEDFLDLSDGLRAVDEAILFLGLDCGDRLGHALALGIDAEEWYHSKGFRIVLPRQDYLDNITWVYQKLCEYHISGFEHLKTHIMDEFVKCFGRIYGNHMNAADTALIMRSAGRQHKTRMTTSIHLDFNIYNYYSSMKLRGDEPYLYYLGYYDKNSYLLNGNPYAINAGVESKIRYMPDAALLYYHYHFNPSVRETGGKILQFKVEKDYIAAVDKIQKALQKDIAGRGIAIETNPSSNYLIGTFRSYDRHPIIKFYNRGLTTDPVQIQNCPQISVSINTDDQGVFSTSLENEYALMACALEKVKDQQENNVYNRTMIYEWLEHVRIMGNEQSFGFEQYEKAVNYNNNNQS